MENFGSFQKIISQLNLSGRLRYITELPQAIEEWALRAMKGLLWMNVLKIFRFKGLVWRSRCWNSWNIWCWRSFHEWNIPTLIQYKLQYKLYSASYFVIGTYHITYERRYDGWAQESRILSSLKLTWNIDGYLTLTFAVGFMLASF